MLCTPNASEPRGAYWPDLSQAERSPEDSISKPPRGRDEQRSPRQVFIAPLEIRMAVTDAEKVKSLRQRFGHFA